MNTYPHTTMSDLLGDPVRVPDNAILIDIDGDCYLVQGGKIIIDFDGEIDLTRDEAVVMAESWFTVEISEQAANALYMLHRHDPAPNGEYTTSGDIRWKERAHAFAKAHGWDGNWTPRA